MPLGAILIFGVYDRRFERPNDFYSASLDDHEDKVLPLLAIGIIALAFRSHLLFPYGLFRLLLSAWLVMLLLLSLFVL